MKTKVAIVGLLLLTAAAATVKFHIGQKRAAATPQAPSAVSSQPADSPERSRLQANEGPFDPAHMHMWQDQAVFELTGHTDGVLSLAFSPDGRYLVSGGADHTVRLWDMATQQEIRKLEGHSDIVTSVNYSDDGKWIVSAGRDNAAIVWDAATGEMVNLLQHYTTLRNARFLPDGRVVTLTNNEIAISSRQGNQPLIRTTADWSSWKMDISPSGEIATGTARGDVEIWDGKSLRRKEEKSRPAISKYVSTNGIRALCYLDSQRLLIGDSSGQWIWNRKTGEVEPWRSLYMDDVIPMGKSNLFAGARDSVVWCWDGGNGENITMLSQPYLPEAIAADKSCKWLAVGGGGIWLDHMKTWVPKGSSRIQVYDVSHMPSFAAALGNSSDYRPTISTWDRNTQRTVRLRPKDFSPDLLPWE